MQLLMLAREKGQKLDYRWKLLSPDDIIKEGPIRIVIYYDTISDAKVDEIFNTFTDVPFEYLYVDNNKTIVEIVYTDEEAIKVSYIITFFMNAWQYAYGITPTKIEVYKGYKFPTVAILAALLIAGIGIAAIVAKKSKNL